tara:strand:+ start:95 stop:424 length:330 start_codon:yes stop_codon:yes gene_type:complete
MTESDIQELKESTEMLKIQPSEDINMDFRMRIVQILRKNKISFKYAVLAASSFRITIEEELDEEEYSAIQDFLDQRALNLVRQARYMTGEKEGELVDECLVSLARTNAS